MIAIGVWTIASCELRAPTFESCSSARSEGTAWIMGGVGTQAGLNTLNPSLRDPRVTKAAPLPEPATPAEPPAGPHKPWIPKRGPDGRFLSNDSEDPGE
jgi:hypothetical protein